MKLIFRGHDDRYAVEQCLLAYFPEERPVYEGEDGERCAWVNLSIGPTYATATTRIVYDGREGRGISRVLVDHDLSDYDQEGRRQKAIRLSFYKAAVAVTGESPAWGALTGVRPGKLAARLLTAGLSPARLTGCWKRPISSLRPGGGW